MAYEGELLWYCPVSVHIFDFRRTYVLVVSGDDFIQNVELTRNTWGHMLLNTGGRGGYYFQTAGWRTYPRVMNEAQFRRYMEEHKKSVIKCAQVYIPHPEKSRLKLDQILARRWDWGGKVHNCESFVEEIVMAGGGPRLHPGDYWKPVESACIPRNMCQSVARW